MIQELGRTAHALNPRPCDAHNPADVPRRSRIQHTQGQHRISRVRPREGEAGMLALQRCGLGSDERCVGREGEEGAVNKLRWQLVYDCHTSKGNSRCGGKELGSGERGL